MIGMHRRGEGPTTNSYKLIHLSGNESRPTAIRTEYFIILSWFSIGIDFEWVKELFYQIY